MRITAKWTLGVSDRSTTVGGHSDWTADDGAPPKADSWGAGKRRDTATYRKGTTLTEQLKGEYQNNIDKLHILSAKLPWNLADRAEYHRIIARQTEIEAADGGEKSGAIRGVDLADREAIVRAAHRPPVIGQETAGGDVWRDQQGREVRVLKPGDSYEAVIRASGADNYPGLTVGGFLRSLIIGPKSEVERRVMAEGSDSSGGFSVPDILLARIVDRLRAKSVAFRAGASTVALASDKTTIARLATGPTAAWRSENEEVIATDGTLEAVVFAARSLAVLLKSSRELLEDSSNIETALEAEFAGNLASELDRVILVGSGTPPEPKGIINHTNVGSVEMAADGAALANTTAYPKILDTVYEVLRDKGPMPTAAVMHPRTLIALNKLQDAQYQPLRRPDVLATMPFLDTTAIPITDDADTSPLTTNDGSKIILGYWPHCMVGIRSTLRIEILKERYAEFLQYAFLAHLRADVQLEHGESFAVLSKITA